MRRIDVQHPRSTVARLLLGSDAVPTTFGSVLLVTLSSLALACGAGSGHDAEDAGATTGATASGSDDEGSTAAATVATAAESTTSSDSDASSGATTIETGSQSTGAVDDSSGGDTDSGTTGDEANVLFVREDGLDGNPGTRAEPMRTIQWAIAQAVILGGIDTIRVAEGDYEVDYANDAHIVMTEGVSLFGGWRADWDERDPDLYASRIVDVSATSIPTTESDPHRAVEIPEGISAATVVDGFHIGIASGQHRAAVFAAGDAMVTNNVIAPEHEGNPVWIYGVRIQYASPSVVGNRIVVDGGGQTAVGTAIHAMDSDGLFANNVITLLGTTSGVYGIYLSQGQAQLLANSTHAAANPNVRLVYTISAATPTIENNAFEIADGWGVCISPYDATALPVSTRNNLLDCNYTLFGSEPLQSWTTIQQLHDGLDGASGNVKLAETILEPSQDLALDATVPCTVTQGGLDLGATIAADIDGVARTVAFSIGAHEWDGGCR